MAQFQASSGPDGSMILRVIGEIDLANVEELKAAVRPCLQASNAVELDLSDLEFIDSSGLGAFVQLRSEAQLQGATLVLRNLRANIHRIFEITGLAAVFDVRTSGQDAGDAAVT